MSKKLMMNNYSENGLMPVMDGLVCWLDGRDGYEGNRIRDRVGLNDFLLEKDFNNNPFHFMGKHIAYSEEILSLSSNFSIQLSIKINETGVWGLIFSDKAGSNNFKICNRNNGKVGIYANQIGGINEGVPIIYDDKINIIINAKEGVISIFNGTELMNSSSKIFSGINIHAVIGTFKTTAGLDNFCDFELYSLKIYNRPLTEEEIQRNYLYEQSIERGE